jgi:hypothetical protein
MNIINVIDRVSDNRVSHRSWDKLKTIYLHRCGVDQKSGVVLGYDAPSVCDHFTGRDKTYPEVAAATGGEIAYSLMIGGDAGPPEFDGLIWQCLPLNEIGYHARRFSKEGLGIGLIFDGRVSPPSQKMYASLVDLLGLLCLGLGLNPYKSIRGHGEEPGAHGGSKAPGQPHACPGDLLVPNHVRDDTATIMREKGLRKLASSGLVFA